MATDAILVLDSFISLIFKNIPQSKRKNNIKAENTSSVNCWGCTFWAFFVSDSSLQIRFGQSKRSSLWGSLCKCCYSWLIVQFAYEWNYSAIL